MPAPRSQPTVAVAIPAYNEAEGIVGFLADLDEVLAEVASSHTFVVADDCSTDDTVAVLESAAPDYRGRLDLIELDQNRGHGPTVVAAYRRALAGSPEVVVQVDGDGQFDADDLRALFEQYESGCDVVTGNRTGRVDPWFRRVVTVVLRGLMRTMFGVRRHDTNCPFRLYRAEVLRDLLAGLPPDPLVPHVELTVLESRSGAVTAEVDVGHRHRRGAGVGTMWKGRGGARASWRLLRFCGRALIEVTRFRFGR